MKTTFTIYRNLAKRFVAIVLFCTLGFGMLQAGTDYEVIFRNCVSGEDYSVPQTELDKILGTNTYNNGYIASIDEAKNVFTGKHGLYQGVRIGRQDATGLLKMTFADKCQINASKIVFRMAQYFGHDYGKSDNGDMKVTVTYADGSTSSNTYNPKNLASESDTTTTEYILKLIPEKRIKSISFQTLTAEYGRAYCRKFKVYSAPIVTQPIVTDITKTRATLTSEVTDLGSSLYEINKGYGFIVKTNVNDIDMYHYLPAYGDIAVKVGTSITEINKPFTTTITDLIPGTTYYARAYVNSNALADYGYAHSAEVTTFNTKGHVATFNVGNYGTCDIQSIEEFPNTDGITLPKVTPESGYRFAGWSPTSNDATDTIEAGTHYDLTDDITFYAVYIQQFTVQWLIDGKPTTSNSPTTIVDIGSKVTQLPTSPNQEEDCGLVFMGWTDAPIINMQDGRPTTLFTTIEESPQIKENTTFYAVFADITQ